ncbi:hypothetical protein ScPMuIL_000710 [Solemya velum]
MEPTTDEDSLEYYMRLKKVELQAILRKSGHKVSGTKSELAKRVFGNTLPMPKSQCEERKMITTTVPVNNIHAVPDIEEYKNGWTYDMTNFPKITYTHVEEYLLTSSHRTEDRETMKCYRQFVRGYNFYREGYLRKMAFHDIDGKCCYIKSKCLPSMKQGVYEQWVCMLQQDPFTVLKANCTCPAGAGEGCTHVAALLFALDASATSNAEGDGDTACTSRPCEWSKPRKRKLSPKRVKTLKFQKIIHSKIPSIREKKRHVHPEPPSGMFDTLLNRMSSVNPSAVLFHLQTPIAPQCSVASDVNVGLHVEISDSPKIILPSDSYIDMVNYIKENASVPSENIVDEIEYRTRGQSDNHLWHVARRGRITASNFYDVCHRKATTPHEKLVARLMSHKEETTFVPKPLMWGRKMEPVAKKRYIAHKKLNEKIKIVVMEKGLFISSSDPYLGASPDGVVRDKNKVKLIEVKCPWKWRHVSVIEACDSPHFYCYRDDNGAVKLKTNSKYMYQIQGQMAITGINTCYFIIYTLKDMKVLTLEFDNVFWKLSMLPSLKKFYRVAIVPELKKQ